MGWWRAIDWERPWLAPYRADGLAVCARLERGDTVAQALEALADAKRPVLSAGPVRFVPQAELEAGMAYEAFIANRARVPTRDNLHDLFNGLVWLAFPALKRRLNELQAGQIAHSGVPAARGAVRDALTLFDENAAIWQASDEMVEALRARDWQSLFVARRSQWQRTTPTLFGHALLEKLVTPRKAITAHVWCMDPVASVESFMDRELTAEALRQKRWLPLPVLGVPGWWPDNESPEFYGDASVFRIRG